MKIGIIYLLTIYISLLYSAHGIAVNNTVTAEANPTNISAYSSFNWDYIYRYKGSSSVAINDNWIITAAHVADDGGTGSIYINGVEYQQVEVVYHDQNDDPDGNNTADIALVRYNNNFPGHYPIFNRNLSNNQLFLLTGWGKTGTVFSSYFTSGPGGQGVKRWGTNRSNLVNFNVNVGSFSTKTFKMNFNLSNSSYEAGGTLFDSGGGVFINNGGIWRLAGILLYNQPYGQNYNGNYAAQLPIYANWVKSITIDSDQDGISDYNEINDYFTDPNNADTDGDDVLDGDEIYIYSTNPNSTDTDADGLPDGFEVQYSDGLSMDANADTDGDGSTNYEEWVADTNPTNALSRFRIIFDSSSASNVVFTSSTNREYQVQFSTDLINNIWVETNNWIIGLDPDTSVEVPTDSPYRVNRADVRIPL